MIAVCGAVLMICRCAVQIPSGLVPKVQDRLHDFGLYVRETAFPSTDAQVNGHSKFRLPGPCMVAKRSLGFEFSAEKFIDGEFHLGDGDAIQLDRVKGSGATSIKLDSDAARRFNHTALSSKFVPEVTSLHSEAIAVSQVAETATATLSQKFSFYDLRGVLGSNRVGGSEATMTGKSGYMNFAVPKAPGVAKVIDGSFEGPVHFHVIQTAPKHAAVALFGHLVRFPYSDKTVYDVVGDKLTIDRRKASDQIVLRGNIRYSAVLGEGLDHQLDGSTTEFRMTVDDDWNVVSWSTGGSGALDAEAGSP